jgi:NitT/TauT family transport system substrate-binding protein
VVVITNDNSIGNDKIVISDKIKSVKDLKGKKVAAEQGVTSSITWRKMTTYA